jgi:putative ABC transport system substrate-binding protein
MIERGAIKRRDLLRLAGGTVLAWPLAARAQTARLPVIGYLGSETAMLFARRLGAFRRGLGTTGFEEGRNVSIEYRWAEGHNDRLPALAADLVRRQVNIIATPGSVVAALAAKTATATIPIVFEIGVDPVAAGLVASLSRPGGNITGVTSLNTEVGAKRLELLHELIPQGRTFALMVNPTNPKNAETAARDFRDAARSRRLDAHVLHASGESDFAAVFERLADLRVQGLVIANDTAFFRVEPLATLALRHKLPTVHQSREFAVAGGLMGYGASPAEGHGQAGIYTGRILKGERPANLPVYQATKFELVLNLKTANRLGLVVPSTILVRADEVIE